MSYIALFISYDGEKWYYPDPNDHKWDKECPSTVQTWLRDKCTDAIIASFSQEGERKFWALSPCRQIEDQKDVLGFLHNIEKLLEKQINLELENRQNEAARYGAVETVQVELDQIEPFVGKSDKRQKREIIKDTFNRLAGRSNNIQTIFPTPAHNSNKNKKRADFSWFCGLYAQGKTVKRRKL